MASTVFVDGSTLTAAAWFNDVNTVAYTLFGNGSAYTGALTLGSSGNIAVNTNKFTVAASSGNTVVAGTLAVAGAITATSGGTVFAGSGSTTGATDLTITNTSGAIAVGVDSSAGGVLIVGSTAYDAIIRGTSGIAFSANGGANMQMRLSSTGLAVTGTLAVTGATTFTGAASVTGTIAAGTYGLRSVAASGADRDILQAGVNGVTNGFTAQYASSEMLYTFSGVSAAAVVIGGTLATADPAGGTGPKWKLGVAASVSPTSPNRTVRIDIGGTSYYLAAKTTND